MAEETVQGPLTDDAAAQAFEGILNPPPRKKAATPEDTRAAHEGDDNPDDGEEPDGEPEPEEREEEEPEQEPEADDGESEVTVRIDGKDTRMKLRELTDGYLRQSDYSRKTQQLADERKKFEGELASTKAEREQYGAMLGHLKNQMDALMPQEPDWNALLQQHGTEVYLKTRLQWDQAQRNRQAVEAEQQRIAEQQAADQQEAAGKTLAEERSRMLDVIPEWKDEGTMTKERDGMVKWAKGQGFSDDDLNQITDHRAVRVLRLAWLGDRMLRAKASVRPAPEPEEVKPARPLSSAVRTAATGMEAAKKRLAQSGSDEDATALFTLMEQNRRRRA